MHASFPFAWSAFLLGSLVLGCQGGDAPDGEHNEHNEQPANQDQAAGEHKAGEGWWRDAAPQIWTAAYTATPPSIDGAVAGEDVWAKATPITVLVHEAVGGDQPHAVVLRALYTDDAFYMAAEWADDSLSALRKPYVWNAETKTYNKTKRADDQFALQLPISGELTVSMLAPRTYHADAWHWKAGRGNGIGYADDKSHHISTTELKRGTKYDLPDGRAVWIWRPGDAGQSAVEGIPAPAEHAGDEADSYRERTPEGSRADVRARGVHDGTGWTLEMGRVFNTGHDDDAVIDPSQELQCNIAVMNQEGDEDHSVSTMITLRFAPK